MFEEYKQQKCVSKTVKKTFKNWFQQFVNITQLKRKDWEWKKKFVEMFKTKEFLRKKKSRLNYFLIKCFIL